MNIFFIFHQWFFFIFLEWFFLPFSNERIDHENLYVKYCWFYGVALLPLEIYNKRRSL